MTSKIYEYLFHKSPVLQSQRCEMIVVVSCSSHLFGEVACERFLPNLSLATFSFLSEVRIKLNSFLAIFSEDSLHWGTSVDGSWRENEMTVRSHYSRFCLNMFPITEDLSSGRPVQCLAKIIKMVLSCTLTWTWSVL